MHFDWSRKLLLPQQPQRDPDAIDVRENPAFNIPSKIAYFLLFLSVCGAARIVMLLVSSYDHPWRAIASIIIVTLLMFGPVIGTIVRATRRHFRDKKHQPVNE